MFEHPPADQDRLPLGIVCLAAGTSRRFGGDKLAADWFGEPMGFCALRLLRSPFFEQRVLVTDRPFLADAAQGWATVVPNPAPARGQSHSVKLGLAALGAVQGALFLPADMPLLTAASLRELARCFTAHPNDITAAAWQGQIRSPVLFPARFFGELAALTGDAGGRRIVAAHPDAVQKVELPPAEMRDADTPFELEELRALFRESAL